MKAVYAGSFDPFTNGHLNIVKQMSQLFEKSYLVVAVNSNKKRRYDKDNMTFAIEDTLKRMGIYNVYVVQYDGLIANFCKENDVNYLVRGLRNNIDYNYEENIAQINHLIMPTLATIYFRATDETERCVSSSMVKELFSYGNDVESFVPEEVYKIMIE